MTTLSHRARRLACIAGLVVLLGLVAGGLGACGGGCGSGGGQAKKLVDKLPAKATGVVVMAVDEILPPDERTTLLDQLTALGDVEIPEWVTKVSTIAVVADWGSAAAKPDCKAAVDHAVKIAKVPEGSEADMRKGAMMICQRSPQMASCMLAAKEMQDLGKCVESGGGDGPSGPVFDMAFVIMGSFDADETVKALASIGEAPRGAVEKLGDGAVMAGTPEMLGRIKASWSGEGDALSKNERLMGLLEKVGLDGSVVMAGYGLDKMTPFFEEGATKYNLRDGIEVKAYAKADPEVIGEFKKRANQAKAFVGLVEKDKIKSMAKMRAPEAQVEQLGPLIDAGTELLDSLEIEGEGGEIMLSAKTSVDLGATLVPILTAVSVPAFVKYMRRAKTTEAIDNLDKIYKGAVAYFQMPKADPNSPDQLLPCQFPKSVQCTPAYDPCKGDGDQFDPRPELWTAATWAALSFEMTDKHFFQYCFESSGTGSTAVFTATAHGDLDCDGVKSTFRRVGFGVAGSGLGECSVKGSAAFIKEKETE